MVVCFSLGVLPHPNGAMAREIFRTIMYILTSVLCKVLLFWQMFAMISLTSISMDLWLHFFIRDLILNVTFFDYSYDFSKNSQVIQRISRYGNDIGAFSR